MKSVNLIFKNNSSIKDEILFYINDLYIDSLREKEEKQIVWGGQDISIYFKVDAIKSKKYLVNIKNHDQIKINVDTFMNVKSGLIFFALMTLIVFLAIFNLYFLVSFLALLMTTLTYLIIAKKIQYFNVKIDYM